MKGNALIPGAAQWNWNGSRNCSMVGSCMFPLPQCRLGLSSFHFLVWYHLHVTWTEGFFFIVIAVYVTLVFKAWLVFNFRGTTKWLFSLPEIEKHLKAHRSGTVDNSTKNVTNQLTETPVSEFQLCYEKRENHPKRCLVSQMNYFEGDRDRYNFIVNKRFY